MEVKTIGIRELQAYLDKENVIIVDLRSNNEYKKKHIERAINIPYEQLEESEDLLDRNKMIIFYCERGSKSLLATKNYTSKKYLAKSLIGGIQGYYNQHLN